MSELHHHAHPDHQSMPSPDRSATLLRERWHTPQLLGPYTLTRTTSHIEIVNRYAGLFRLRLTDAQRRELSELLGAR
jgi:hypothetical protein